MSVREAQQKIDSAEFSEWIAFHKQKPFTVNTTDNILATLAAMVGNSLRKKGSKPIKPEDFLPVSRQPRREDAKVIEMKLRTFFRERK